MITQNNNRIVRNPGSSTVILFGSFFFFLCIFSLLASWIMPRIENVVVATRIITLFQAIFIFILPALLTAILSTRLPATMLSIDHKPKLMPILTIVSIIIVAIPAMNCIIEWNASLHLPDSMKAIEDALREMEQSASDATNMLLGGNTIGSLIVTILIVGVMAGLSEELFFRGAFQNILTSTRLNKQVAVWIVAFVFSFIHFQFFGFVPRLLLGAFFGYILIWGNNLWYCIIAHALNNTFAVLASRYGGEDITIDFNTIGQTAANNSTPWALIIASVLLTSLGIIVLRRQLQKKTKKSA